MNKRNSGNNSNEFYFEMVILNVSKNKNHGKHAENVLPNVWRNCINYEQAKNGNALHFWTDDVWFVV
ncbi:hypothetical protein T06_17037 [Trichinella sp. T6]|nr:hypothetical protein T06_17037 [Trichinella sp. T6]